MLSMRDFRRAAVILICSGMSIFSTTVFADAAAASSLKPDVRLLIDISGSMKDSDPDNLRAPALDLIVRLLPEGAKAGVWIFGEQVRQLVPHRVIDDSWRAQASAAVAEIDHSGQRTHIPRAINAATYDLKRITPGYRPSVILLTDGKVDVSESPMANAAAARKVLDQTARRLKVTGIPVHTIALSDNADWEFLRSLAALTGGVADKAETADQLTAVYYQALEMVAPMERVPLLDNVFYIDENVREFTALVFFPPGQTSVVLESPVNTVSSPETPDTLAEGGTPKWFRNEQFSAVTVSTPQSGNWKLLIPDSSEARVTVISDMSLAVDPLPTSLPVGKVTELGIALKEKGRVITGSDFLELLDIVVEISSPDSGDVYQLIEVSKEYATPDAGEYRVTVPAFEIPGRYGVKVQVNGKTFRRELPMLVDVLAPRRVTRISTRSEQIAPVDLNRPLAVAGGVATALLVLLYWYLWRRRQRRIEAWRKRARRVDEPLVGGIRADSDLDRG